MRCVSSLSPFSYVLFHSAMSDDFIEQSCRIAAGRKPSLNYTFCVSTLKASPKSHGADLDGLMCIVLRLAIDKVTYINDLIQKLAKDPTVD